MIRQETLLFTGGSGLLGSAFRKLLPAALYPAHMDFNVADLRGMERFASGKEIRTVVHAAAFTSPPKVDRDPIQAIESNIIGTGDMVRFCASRGARLIYISTDYVFKGDTGNYGEEDPVYPVNKYAWSKLGGECAVRMYDNHVIVRTSFGPDEFPYDRAFVDQWTSRESVSVIAKMLLAVVVSDFRGTIHVGGERKTVHEYAVTLSPQKAIGQLKSTEVSFRVPRDTSLSVELYRKIFDHKK